MQCPLSVNRILLTGHRNSTPPETACGTPQCALLTGIVLWHYRHVFKLKGSGALPLVLFVATLALEARDCMLGKAWITVLGAQL